jgi:hypothetical protein
VRGSERAEALAELGPLPGARPSFRSLAEVAKLLSADRTGQALQLVQNLACVVAASITKRLQTIDEARAILDGLEDQSTQIFGIICEQRP